MDKMLACHGCRTKIESVRQCTSLYVAAMNLSRFQFFTHYETHLEMFMRQNKYFSPASYLFPLSKSAHPKRWDPTQRAPLFCSAYPTRWDPTLRTFLTLCSPKEMGSHLKGHFLMLRPPNEMGSHSKGPSLMLCSPKEMRSTQRAPFLSSSHPKRWDHTQRAHLLHSTHPNSWDHTQSATSIVLRPPKDKVPLLSHTHSAHPYRLDPSLNAPLSHTLPTQMGGIQQKCPLSYTPPTQTMESHPKGLSHTLPT